MIVNPPSARLHRMVTSMALASALGLLAAGTTAAQRPVLRTAATHATLQPVAAEGMPGPAAPEPLQGTPGTPPVKDDLFAGTEKFAKGATDVTEVDMDPSSLNMVNGPDSHRAHNMVLNVVRTYSYDKPGMYNPADLDEFRHRLEGGDWHCSVHTRDLKSGNSTDVCNRHRAPDLVENAIITASPKSLTFIHTIRKANGQGGELDFSTSPGFSMVEPDLAFGLSAQIARAVASAEGAALANALRAQLPRAEDFHFEMPKDMAALSEQFRNFKPMSPDQVQRLQQQLQDLKKNAPDFNLDLQHLRDQLQQWQRNVPDQP